MRKLQLSSNDRIKLGKVLSEMESKNGAKYKFVPKNASYYCTCQGNCDGKTGGCAWH